VQKLLGEEHRWRRQGGQVGGGLLILMARLEAAHDIVAGCGGIAATTASTAPDHLLDKGGLEFSSVHLLDKGGPLLLQQMLAAAISCLAGSLLLHSWCGSSLRSILKG